jgi:hypothetical protein
MTADPEVSKPSEKPIPSPKDTNAGDEKAGDPLATTGEILSFVPNIRVKIMIVLGLICACVSGTVFPALAFFFSTSFEDLSGDIGKKESIFAMANKTKRQ